MTPLSDGLTAATEDGIRRAVAMIDTMKTRGEADALIAPLRGRLARLQPVRPLNLTRLLFLPLNSVIVPVSVWQKQSAGVPRPSLAPLSRALQEQWSEVDDINARLSGATTADTAIARELGGKVWAEAAARLGGMTPPADWQASSGLRDADFVQVARVVASVLAHGEAVMQLAEDFLDPASLDASLTSICRLAIAPGPRPGATPAKSKLTRDPGVLREDATNPLPLATLLAVLMQLAPRADRVLAIAETVGRGDARIAGSAHIATEFMLEAMRREAATAALPIAAAAMQRGAVKLGQLDELMQVRPGPRQRLHEARQSIDATCRHRLDSAIVKVTDRNGLLHRSQADLEAACDDIRQFAEASACISNAAHYRQTLRQTALWLAQPGNRELDQIDRKRLIEALGGVD